MRWIRYRRWILNYNLRDKINNSGIFVVISMIETSITREPEVTCWRYYYNEFYDKRRVKVLSAILQIVNFNIIVIIQISTNKGKSFNLFANYWPNQILRTFFRLSKESEQNPETRSFPKSNISNLIKSYIDLDIVNDLNRLKIFSTILHNNNFGDIHFWNIIVGRV